jgi:hypothetical protein
MKLTDIQPGTRVRIHPASDWFMRGIRYADVLKVGKKYIHLHDTFTGTTFRMRPENLEPAE